MAKYLATSNDALISEESYASICQLIVPNSASICHTFITGSAPSTPILTGGHPKWALGRNYEDPCSKQKFFHQQNMGPVLTKVANLCSTSSQGWNAPPSNNHHHYPCIQKSSMSRGSLALCGGNLCCV